SSAAQQSRTRRHGGSGGPQPCSGPRQSLAAPDRSRARQLETHDDRPEESRKACERDEGKKLDAQDFEPTQFTANGDGDAGVHGPARDVSTESGGDGDSGDQYPEWNRESRAADRKREPVERIEQRGVLRDSVDRHSPQEAAPEEDAERGSKSAEESDIRTGGTDA